MRKSRFSAEQIVHAVKQSRTGNYDITFSSQADDGKRRRRRSVGSSKSRG
jgi:hypothetical protein